MEKPHCTTEVGGKSTLDLLVDGLRNTHYSPPMMRRLLKSHHIDLAIAVQEELENNLGPAYCDEETQYILRTVQRTILKWAH